MSTKKMTPQQLTITIVVAFTALAGLIAVGLLLREYAPGNMGNGFLSGAGIAILGLVIVWWRLTRRPGSTSTFERAWTHHGDERDNAVLTRALAVVGISAPLLSGAASIIIALGVPMMPVLAILNFSFIGAFILAFTVINRRN